jgi:tetratricopeptide (TPR) repeat protein
VLAEAEAAAAAFTSNADPGDAFLGLLDQEHDNLRAALAWAAEANALELEVRLAVAARWFWVIRGFLSEGRRYFDGIFARTVGAPKPLRALALVHGATFPYRQGETGLAKQLWEEALDLYRELDDAEGTARTTAELGSIAVAESDFDRGVAMYEECADLFREQGNTTRLAIALGNLGAIANMRGDRMTAVRHLTEAIALTREIGDDDSLAINLHNIARSELALGRTDEGRAALTESIALARRLGYREVLAYCLGGLAELAFLEDDAERAATMQGASQHLFHEIGAALDPEEVECQERVAAFARERLGQARFEERRGAGAALTLDELLEDVASRT